MVMTLYPPVGVACPACSCRPRGWRLVPVGCVRLGFRRGGANTSLASVLLLGMSGTSRQLLPPFGRAVIEQRRCVVTTLRAVAKPSAGRECDEVQAIGRQV